MIRLPLHSQLGNQMFQYAAARALAERRGTGLHVDVLGYARNREWAKYQLWRFPKLALGSFAAQAGSNLLQTVQRPLHRARSRFEMSGLGFDPAVNDLPDGTELRGFFTSERYFLDCRGLISTLFDLTEFLSPDDTAALSSAFPGRTPVSVHVRRGDYVGNKLFDVGNLDGYYGECFRRILDEVPDAYFVVLSDDTDWCAQWDLLTDIDAIVMRQPREALRDLALMAWCRHHVMTNSTFSWWGAWLGRNPAKKVFLPRRWLNRWSTQECGVDVPGWIEIEHTS